MNGVTIVHSHPYSKMDARRPDHDDSYSEFQLLHQLSSVWIGGAAFVSLLLAAFLTVLYKLSFNPVCPDYLTPIQGKPSLRDLPVI